MASKRKSLAQELAELYNPAPATEHDPDALDLGDGGKLASDDEYAEARRAPSRHAPEKARLLRGDIVLKDAAYRGRKSSRAAVFGDGADAEDSGTDGEEDEDDGDVDLELGDVDGVDGLDEEEEEEEEDEKEEDERRATAARAGPSGRGSAAAAAAGPSDKKAHRAGAARAAIRQGTGGRPGTLSSAEEEEEEGDYEADEDGDRAGSSEADGSDSDLDLGQRGGEGDDGEDDQLDGDQDGPGPRAAAVAAVTRRAAIAGGGGGGDELDALEAEYEALQEEDEKQLAALRQKGERDRVKGIAVRQQQVLYERALEQRILLQKCLQASNGLPRPDTYALLARTQPDVRTGFSQLAAAARDTLDHLLELQRTLMARNKAITLPPSASAPAGAAKRRREDIDGDDSGNAERATRAAATAATSDGGDGAAGDDGDGVEALWRRLSSHHEALAPYRDVSLDSWHRRTVLSSGSGALRNSGLRALNQSVSSQVAALMRDPAKFIKRTRLTLAACPRVLCEPPCASSAAATAAAADPLGAHDGEPGGAAAAAAAAVQRPPSSSVAADMEEEERDAETYDDSEFYQQLLKEFLDKGLAEGAATGAPKAAKKRKQVDRRASKGRKLRYHVQEKLVAFMAPVDFEPPSFAANLFSNLFGHAGK